jgi:hypothetical protein
MLVLFETPAGYALFKVKGSGKIATAKVEDIYKEFESPAAAANAVSLQAFHRFTGTSEVSGFLQFAFRSATGERGRRGSRRRSASATVVDEPSTKRVIAVWSDDDLCVLPR